MKTNTNIRRMKPILRVLLPLLALLLFASCAAAPQQTGDSASYFTPAQEQPEGGPANGMYKLEDADENKNAYAKENPFVRTSEQPVSTFSSDVDTASYTLLRKMILAGYGFEELAATAGSSLRTEEMVNYFSYECPAPDGALFGVKATVAKTPFNSESFLLKLTLRAADAPKYAKNNLVFLIDVSGSMSSQDKLPLLKKAFGTLTDNLDGDDVVSIVTYSGREETVLDGCSGARKETILRAVDSLSASGSTNGEAGLKKAYELAEKHFMQDGNNRIILASDGDLNVGISSPSELKTFVETKRDSGVFLSVLGFGVGNYKDANMEALADNGNGAYYYIDGETEAEKIFSDDLFSSLYTVAKDVKLQLTFNPERVESYRLIGYENRLLAPEDFKDDRKDAGELGAGGRITVFYELKLLEGTAPFANLAVRAKEPDGVRSVEENHTVGANVLTDAPDGDFLFASSVAELSLLIQNSAYKGQASLEDVLTRLSSLDLEGDVYKTQFRELVGMLAGNREH